MMTTTNNYTELNKHATSVIRYLVSSQIPKDENCLDYISTGYMILSKRNKIDYSSYIIRKHMDYIITRLDQYWE